MNLLEMIQRDEGCRLKAYQDTLGVWTIGYGRNLQAMGYAPDVAATMEITQQQAEEWLDADLRRASHFAETILWQAWDHMNDARRAVAASMIFVLGLAGTLKFRNCLTAWKARDYGDAADHLLNSLWRQQAPNRVQRLAQQLRTGEWAMTQQTKNEEAPREAIGTGKAAVTGTAGAAIGQVFSTAILTSNPELVLFAPAIGTIVTGVLSGVGSASRNRLHRDPTGVVGFLAALGAWLG